VLVVISNLNEMKQSSCDIGVFLGGPEIPDVVITWVKHIESEILEELSQAEGISVKGTIAFGSPDFDFSHFEFSKKKVSITSCSVEFVLNVPYRYFREHGQNLISKVGEKVASLLQCITDEQIANKLIEKVW
jgi:hypothetical protein